MKYKENIGLVADLQPDYLGFIFYEKSKRHFRGEMPRLPEHIKKIGVFVNEKERIINEMILRYNLDGVQLHGDESPLFCKELKVSNRPDFEIIKAFAVSEDFNFKNLEQYTAFCDYFLFDTKGKERGGNGTLFDWKILENYFLDKPFFLSGGIGLAEVNRVNAFLKSPLSDYCYAIDVNSRFETEPGKKKIKELKEFIELTAKEN